MKNKISASIQKCLNSFTYAKNGLLHVVMNENNFNYHTVATIIVLVVAIILKLNVIEWIILIILIGIVFISEIFNTAIEKTVDMLSPEYNPKAGLVKDVAAAGVLVASIISAICGSILFLNKIF